MMQLGTQRTGSNGRFEVGGCDAVALAEQFGTPLYVLDQAHLLGNCQAYRTALAAVAPRGRVFYAGKALLTTAVARLVADAGLGIDVASGGELITALRAGLDPAELVLHGNYKTDEEITLALQHGVGRAAVDSLPEIDDWSRLAATTGTTARVLIRVNPNVKPKTHTSIQTGQIDSKFGLSIQAGAAMEAVERALAAERVELLGIHSHIGSGVLGWQAFAAAAEELGDFLAQVRDATGVVLDEVNLGGGLGIRYLPEHDPPPIPEFVAHVAGALLARTRQHGLPDPLVMLEPGRSIVGEAGSTLYRIGVVHTIPGVRTYVSVDGGLSDNPRPELYDAEYHVFIADRPEAPAETLVTVAGKHCETDTLFRDVKLADPQPGDILAVQSTGAYCYSMSSNYNRFRRPPIVLVGDGRAELIVRRETYDDLLRCDLLPERLLARCEAAE